MKILIYSSNPEKLKDLSGKGFQAVYDPAEPGISAVVITNETADFLLQTQDNNLFEDTPVFIETAGGLKDLVIKKKNPGVVFYKSIEELLNQLQEIKAKQTEVNLHKQQEEPSTKNSLLISTYANKGGVGKTTSAIALATVLAEKGLSVCLCDLDFGGANIQAFYGIKKEIPNYLENPFLIDNSLVTITQNLKILPSPKGINPKTISESDLESFLKSIKGKFDIVVCDTCPAPWEKGYMSPVFSESDFIYAIVDQSLFSIEEVRIYAPQLLLMGAKLENIRIIVNKYSPKLVSLKEIERAFNEGFKNSLKNRLSVAAVIPHEHEENISALYKGKVLNKEIWNRVVEEILKKLSKNLVAETKEKPQKILHKILPGKFSRNKTIKQGR